ncbi:Ig-like domain-containing protein [Pseudorhodoferax sp.]|uniref:Ig-like domain-containing protein n=1 Tax=Pseudorhodoferax sp. TaxID=1993553 RepID=UPI002DD66CF3|nr:Ig-like domain-containing protein [Pseudorhodoferax sp.]
MLAVTTAGLLAACGGGGGSGGTDSGGGGGVTPTPAVASVEVLSSASTLSSASANTVTITALVKNASNNGMSGVDVAFSADSGVLQAVTAQSDANGTATATLATGADRSNRDIRVTVKAGAITNSVVVPVTGTSASVVGVGSVLMGGTATYAVTLRDSGGNPVSGVAVAVRSSLGNNVSPAALTTDVNGGASFNYVANNAGNDTLSVSGAGASATLAVVVSGDDFSVVSPSAGTEVFVNTAREVRVRYRSSGVGVAGQMVNFSTTRGAVSLPSVLTDANGEAAVTVTSLTAGPATVTAQIAGGALTSVPLLFTAATPAAIVLQVNPGAIPPNATGSSANQAQLQAVVRDGSGNPVKGRTVNFTLLADTSGGRISTGTGTTDANGVVSDTFIPGTQPTATDGVRIRATVAGTSVESIATLTVSNRALFISIATSNTIGNVDETTYTKPFSLQVNDATGAAVANQTVVLSVFPTWYGKGNMAWNGDDAWVVASRLWCPNEDLNKNGILDAGEDSVALGTGNGNGRLEPGAPIIVTPGSVTTDANGRATFSLTYGEQYARWLILELTARSQVAGTESRAVYTDETWILASDVTSETIAPAGARSPFGTNASCTVPD